MSPKQAFQQVLKQRKVNHDLEKVIANSNYWSYRYILEMGDYIPLMSEEMKACLFDVEVLVMLVNEYLPDSIARIAYPFESPNDFRRFLKAVSYSGLLNGVIS